VRCVNPCLTKFFREIFAAELPAVFLGLREAVNHPLTLCRNLPQLSHIIAQRLVQLWHTGDAIIEAKKEGEAHDEHAATQLVA
jgi:hypothetical protein